MTDAFDDLSRTQGVDAGAGRPPDGTPAARESGDTTRVAEADGDRGRVTTDPGGQAQDAAEARRHQRVRSIIEWVAVVVGALVVALVVKTFLFQAFYIPSASMEPTLEKGDRVLVNKLSYDLHDVNRGDVVVFELPPDEVGPDGIKDLIKRVVGLPGDVIETRDGVVYVNDRRLDEPYLADGMVTGDPASGNNPGIVRQTIPDGMVFVMGDNRSNSHDSRYSDRGPIPIDSIVGRAFVIVWPLSELGGL
ncbi:MAG: signal peptidase I [Acidimicrobiia bacterium]